MENKTFSEKLWTLINEEFLDFQTDNGIEDGGLEPWLSNQLDSSVDNLVDIVGRCLQWQDTHNAHSVQIKTAVAEYTGGGIYVYVGEFEDGTWFMTGDLCGNSVEIVNAEPLQAWDDAWYPSWQQEHLIRTVADATLLRRILVAVKKALDNGVDMNACGSEIEERIQILKDGGEI